MFVYNELWYQRNMDNIQTRREMCGKLAGDQIRSQTQKKSHCCSDFSKKCAKNISQEIRVGGILKMCIHLHA